MLYDNERNELYGSPTENLYGFKQIWILTFQAFDPYIESPLHYSDITEVRLNNQVVDLKLFKHLYDYNRDVIATKNISNPTASVELVITDYDEDTDTAEYFMINTLSSSIAGIISITSDYNLVDNTDENNPKILQDTAKVDVTTYDAEQGTQDNRLNALENTASDLQTQINTGVINNVTDVKVNGNSVVTNHIANVDITGKADISKIPTVITEIFPSVANNTLTINEDLTDTATGVPTRFTDNIVFSSDLSVTENSPNFNVGISDSFKQWVLGDIANVADMLKTYVFFALDSNITYDTTSTIQKNLIWKYDNAGNQIEPTDLEFTSSSLIVGLKPLRTAYNVIGTYIPKSLAIVSAISGNTLTYYADNINQITEYNQYDGYRSGTLIHYSANDGTYITIQDVPVPTSDSDLVSIYDTNFYTPTKDMSPMAPQTIFANLSNSSNAGDAYDLSAVRTSLLTTGTREGYDNYINFVQDNVPPYITNSNFDTYVNSLVIDGNDCSTTAQALAVDFDVRYLLSNRGIIYIAKDTVNQQIEVTEIFTKTTILTFIDTQFMPLINNAAGNKFTLSVSDGTVIESGFDNTSFATSAQGAKADSAIQTVSVVTGTTNGTIKTVINGNTIDNIAVKGLSSAAYQPTSTFATAAQGTLASTALQQTDIYNNTDSTATTKALSANQGYVLQQQIDSLAAGGKYLGQYATKSILPTNTSDFDITVMDDDYVQILADESHSNQYTRYKVNNITDGVITWLFNGFVPPDNRDFVVNPITNSELATNAVTNNKIVDGTISKSKLDTNTNYTLNKADTALQNINESTGSGNVVSDISQSGVNVLVTKGITALTSLSTTGTGNVVSNISQSGNAITITKGVTALTSVPAASTTAAGIVQLNNTVTSTSTSQALTANQGKVLADTITTLNGNVVHTTGNEGIDGVKTFVQQLVVPSKTALPTTPIATQYATESQVASGLETKQNTLSRTVQVNLASTSSISDTGGNLSPGVSGILAISNGGTGQSSLTSGQALIGNGTSAVSFRAIDTTTGGTASSTSLITSGAVNAGLAAKQANLNRTVQANLGNTTAATDTGGNIAPGITGVLPIANGGTGSTIVTSSSGVVSKLFNTSITTSNVANGNLFLAALNTNYDITGRIDYAQLTSRILTSPALTGVPTAPTAAAGTNTTQIATTAFVSANSYNVAKYTCTGTADDVAISNLISTWLGSGTGVIYNLTIIGTFGWSTSPSFQSNTAYMNIVVPTNVRAVFGLKIMLDFRNCTMSKKSFAAGQCGIYINPVGTRQIYVTIDGLKTDPNIENAQTSNLLVVDASTDNKVPVSIVNSTLHLTGYNNSTYPSVILLKNYAVFDICNSFLESSQGIKTDTTFKGVLSMSNTFCVSSANSYGSVSAVYDQGSGSILISNSYLFSGSNNSPCYCVYSTGSSLISLDNCVIKSEMWQGGSSRYGIYLLGANKIMISNCIIENPNVGIFVNSAGNKLTISNNVFLKNTADITIVSSNNVMIVGNMFKTASVSIGGTAVTYLALNATQYMPQYSNQFST
jgi:hypothetical protein